MDKLTEFQHKMLSDPQARRDFAAHPTEYLEQHGIDLPPGTKLPAHIPAHDLDLAVEQLDEKLKKKGVDPATLDLDKLREAMDELKREASPQTDTERAAGMITVSGIVAVCAVVVVSVPVTVIGASAKQSG